MVKEHNECLQEHRDMNKPDEIIEECVGASFRLQSCYDKVEFYNSKCAMYLSEFRFCVERNQIESITDFKQLKEICKNEITEVTVCTAEFVNFDPFILLERK